MGNIKKISENTLSAATNAFQPGKLNYVFDQTTGGYGEIWKTALHYKDRGELSVVVGDDNYGEGSSREQAAMQPRYLGVGVVLVKSFARIHESNLKKQGILALTFKDPKDYGRILEKDRISVAGVTKLAPGSVLTVTALHDDGSKDVFEAGTPTTTARSSGSSTAPRSTCSARSARRRSRRPDARALTPPLSREAARQGGGASEKKQRRRPAFKAGRRLAVRAALAAAWTAAAVRSRSKRNRHARQGDAARRSLRPRGDEGVQIRFMPEDLLTAGSTGRRHSGRLAPLLCFLLRRSKTFALQEIAQKRLIK